MVANASAQIPEPNVSPWQKNQKRLTPLEQRERQKKLDDDYKAATNKIPDQRQTTPGLSFGRLRPIPSQKEAAVKN
jgi:hypothetical protein